MSADEDKPRASYITDYDTAQRRSGRLAAEAIVAARQSDQYAAQGHALAQLKELARAGFLLRPEATTAAFEHLWRTAFQVAEQEQKGGVR